MMRLHADEMELWTPLEAFRFSDWNILELLHIGERFST